MIIDYDTAKNERNIADRGLSFDSVVEFDFSNARYPGMTARKKPDPERIDKENPEWTATTFKRARPAREVLPEVVPPKLAAEMLKPKRGRPAGSTKVDAKQAVNLRLDPDVLAVLRATGPGWQTRVNTMLRERFAL